MAGRTRQSWLFEKAPAPYVVRCADKDEFYKSYVVDDVEEVATRLFGTRWVNAHEQEVQLAAQAAYFVLAIQGGRQTLGEEYCDLLAVHRAQRLPASALRRLVQVVLHLAVPYLIARRLPTLVQRHVPRQQQNAVQLMAKQLLQELHRFHLALFFISGTYYWLSSRVADTVQLLMNAPSPGLGSGYALFGWSILVQQAVQSALFLKRVIGQRRAAGAEQPESASSEGEDDDDDDADDARDADASGAGRCGICLSVRGRRGGPTTATKCGHLFCWDCVSGLCKSSAAPHCPLCRERLTLATLAPVYTC